MNYDISRRQLLQRGTASILIVGGASACRGDAPASSAWRASSESHDDPRLRFLSHAILAPSPHNRQPWLIALDDDDANALTLYPDLTRLLPETDPPNRQILIGLGAFIEASGLGASQDGRSLIVEPFPEGVDDTRLDDRPIARMTLGEAGSARTDPLAEYLPERRTNRKPFKDIVPEKDEIQALGTALQGSHSWWGTTVDSESCETLRSLCKSGWEIETRTLRTHLESVNLTRIGRKEIEANPDGISLSGLPMEAYSRLGVLSRERMKDPDSRAFAGGLDFYNGLIDTAHSFGWLATQDNSRLSQLNAGRDWLRLHLAATRAGIAIQPLSQTLQEFPEMRALYQDVHAHLGISEPSRVQGLFRLGFASDPQPSPRWPLETRLIDLDESSG